MKIGAVVLVSLVLLGVGAFLLLNTKHEEGGICTMEAMMCPDGSYVGRVGPNCEFAACPTGGSSSSSGGEAVKDPITLKTKINQSASGLDVTLRPVAVLEDSRCPRDVTCIQAGTVRVRVILESGMGEALEDFELNRSITTEAEEITLVEVMPVPVSTSTIIEKDYEFYFEVKKRAEP